MLIASTVFTDSNEQLLPLSYYNGVDDWLTVVANELDLDESDPPRSWCPEKSTIDGLVETPRSYGMNDWGVANSACPWPVTLKDIVQPTRTFLFTDTYPAYYLFPTGWSWPIHLGGRWNDVDYADYRHFGGVNMGYVDGHVDAPKLTTMGVHQGTGVWGPMLPYCDLATCYDQELAPWHSVGSQPIGCSY